MNAREAFEAFARAHNLAFTCKRIDARTDWLGDATHGWTDDDLQHFRCTIRRGHARMVVQFSQGSAHTEDPTLADVLSCLQMDCAGFENARGFDEWSRDLGYDVDSRKAERTYRAVERQHKALARLLNEDERTALYALEGL